MFRKLEIGLTLAKRTLTVLSERKRFLFFPACTLVLGFICFLAFTTAALLTLNIELSHIALGNNHKDILAALATRTGQITAVIYLILFLFTTSFIATIINSALMLSAIKYFQGEKVTFSDVMKIVFSRLGKLLQWTVMVTVLDTIMFGIENLISRKSELASNIIGVVEKTAWAVVSFFVLPIIITENIGPIAAIKRSGSLFKKAWGVALGSYTGIGLIIFGLFLIIFSPVAIACYLKNSALIQLTSIVSFILFIAVMIFNATIRMILKAALYLYATGEQLDNFYDKSLLASAFKPCKN